MRRKIKIMHVSESSETGGAETVLLNIVNHLDKTKYDSIVVLLKTGWLDQKLKEIGISPIIFKSDRPYDINFLIKLWIRAKREAVDLIHSHLPSANAYSCLAGIAAGIPVVTTYHGLVGGSEEHTRSDKLKFLLVRNLSKRIVVVSDFLKNELIQFGEYPPSKLKTIYNGVHWERFDSPFEIEKKKRELKIHSDEKVIGMVANLKPTKGYEYFIRAAAIIAKNIPQVKFLIIGEEEKTIKEMLVREAKMLGLEEKISFLGFREDVPELLRILDVFVLSSISEGMSIATIEAMGAGVPVVVTESGGPQELVKDGKTGFLVPPKNENNLAKKVIFLLQNEKVANTMATEAKFHVRKEFGIEKMIKNYETIYSDCLSPGGKKA
jgi:glycosyltransferase involved in cell wall biosynthesis